MCLLSFSIACRLLKILLVPYALILCLVIHSAFAAESRSGKKVVAQGKAVISDTVSYQQAKTHALNQARALAVDSAAGISLSSFTLLQNELVVADFVKSFSRGFIISEKIIDWQSSWLDSTNAAEPNFPVFTVTLEAEVLVPDQMFYKSGLLQVSLNKETYVSGDKATISVSSRETMIVILANYTAAGTVIPLFPNEYSLSSVISAGNTIIFPGSHARGMEIVLSPPRGYEKSIEAFIVVGIPFTDNIAKMPWATLFEYNREIPYAEFMKTIVSLPIPWLTEEIVVYTVVENDNLQH